MTDPTTAALAIAAAVLLIRFRVDSAWLARGGGAVGISFQLAGYQFV